jgi:16S rRNA (cytosine1402-N4)-methyltransferase
MAHIPVLLKEVIEFLQPEPGQYFIDATFGEGGHTAAILKKIFPQGRLLALDANAHAVAAGRQKFSQEIASDRLVLVHGNFADLSDAVRQEKFPAASGVLFDLGLSSTILDDAVRGFSFQKDGPLDMRYDQTEGETAGDILNKSSEKELSKIIREYGEEKFSRQIVSAIIASRRQLALTSTRQLYALIHSALPARYARFADSSSRRVFQALRIAVNGELESLKTVLPQALDCLRSGGRICVISFHSLEDRIVKQTFQRFAKPCQCPPEFPVCVCGKKPQAKIITAKPVTPSPAEQANNPRSASAKLRVAEKL